MEIVDIVQSALEKDGTLSLLRAQLRSSVQQIIENKNGKKMNHKLNNFVLNDTGKEIIWLLYDLLDTLGLTQTLQIFQIECSIVSYMILCTFVCNSLVRRMN
jgi:hypothetical protein